MKVNKLFGVKSIMNLIYGLLLLAPFVAILSRVIYVQVNPNAKDSYSTQYKYLEENITDINDLQRDNTLYFFIKLNGQDYDVPVDTYRAITYTNPNVIGGNISNELKTKFNNSTQMLLYTSNNTRTIRLDYTDTRGNEFLYVASTYVELKVDTLTISNEAFAYWSVYLYRVYQEPYETLDNAFESSLYTFVQDNDVQSIDFFSWFTNMFLEQNNTHNALYLNFANWYMNYTLLVSSGYLLFFALMWFINYVRKMLEKSSYHDFGGF